MTMNAMRPAGNYDLTEITRLLLKMRDNCVRKAEGEAYDDPERKEKYEALNAAIDLINNPSMLQKWISVKERLPEYGRYMVVTQKGNAGPNVHTATYNRMGWWTYANFGEITHWMPLPVPPEEE